MIVEQIAEVRAKYVVDALLSSVPVGYKKTEAGLIPDDWSATTIGDVTSWLSGGTPSRERLDFWQGNIPWISGSTLKTLEISTSDQHLTIEGVNAGSKMAPLNSTLMLVRGSALHSEIRAGLVVEHVCFNQDVKALIPKPDVLPKFLTIYILAMESELLKLVSSAGNSAGVLDTELVKKFKFLKPSISEQTAIANALSDVDALIQELDKLIAKKQAIKTATMQQLLTGRTRLPQFAHHPDGRKKGYKPSELGEIPEDWEFYSVGDICTFVGGAQPEKSTFSQKPLDGYIRLIQIRDYKSDKDAVYIPANLARKTCDEDDIMIGRYGPPIFQILRGLKGAYNVALIKAVPCTKINKEFFYHFIQNEKLFQLMDMLSQRSSGQTGVELPALKAYPIATPSFEEQSAISDVLSDISNEIQSLERRLTKTRQIKQGMMQELLTGKTRLKL